MISHPTADVATCDAGSKSLAAEAGDAAAYVLGHPGLVAQSPSEERLPLRVVDGDLPPRGTELLLVPHTFARRSTSPRRCSWSSGISKHASSRWRLGPTICSHPKRRVILALFVSATPSRDKGQPYSSHNLRMRRAPCDRSRPCVVASRNIVGDFDRRRTAPRVDPRGTRFYTVWLAVGPVSATN